MTAPQAGARGDSDAGRGDVLAEEGHTPECKKQSRATDCRSAKVPCLTVLKLVSSQSRSVRYIATFGHSSSKAQAWVKGEGFSLNRFCRSGKRSPQ